MAQTNLNIPIDEKLKKELEEFCSNAGIDISAVINMLIKTIVKEQKLPFGITMDSLSSGENIKQLKKVISDVKSVKTKLTER